LQFRVVPAVGADATTPPRFLVLPAAPALPAASVVRPLALLEEMSMYFADAPAETAASDRDGPTRTWKPVCGRSGSGWTTSRRTRRRSHEIWEF